VGLYTGAGAPSEAKAKLFGGAAGRSLDPCYHRACDTTENIDREVLEQNTRALVRVLRAVAIAAPTAAATAATAISGMILIVDVKVASASRSVGLGASGRVR
jgi:hypothetical protein